jgi:hypothetical protein
MAELKQHTTRHLGAARQWLLKAEEAFGRNRDVRGELDLFLAQAEMQHAREANRSQHWRYRYPVLRQGLAFALAMIVAVGGLGGVYWSFHKPISPAPSVVREVKGNMPSPIILERSVAPLQQVEAVASPVQTETTMSRQQPPQSSVREEAPSVNTAQRAPDKDVVLTPDQMQMLVRTAGKSLRGQ